MEFNLCTDYKATNANSKGHPEAYRLNSPFNALVAVLGNALRSNGTMTITFPFTHISCIWYMLIYFIELDLTARGVLCCDT